MSTDTEEGSQATESGTEKYELALKGVDRFWKWAEKEGLPKELVMDLVSEGEEEEKTPPFHTTLAWFDLYSPHGVKIHATVREGATASKLQNMLEIAALVSGVLIDTDSWRAADRLPQTNQEIAETKVKMEFAGSPDAEGVRKIAVESIRKGFTDTGKLYYNVKGHPWNQWGVKAWPDSSNIAKIGALVDLDNWDVATGAEVAFSTGELFAIVSLKPDGKPLKVMDWEGPNVLKVADEIPF